MTPTNLSQHIAIPANRPLTSKKKGGKESSRDAIAHREIATTNNTLNAFVGNKQRSWMTNPSAPISPSSTSSMQTMSRKRSVAGKQLESALSTAQQGRPNIPPSPGPGHTQFTTSSSTRRQSGQVNSTPSNGIGREAQVLPSPAPSEGRPSPAAPTVPVPETINLTDDQEIPASITSQRASAPTLQENQTGSNTIITRTMETNSGNQTVVSGSPCSPQFMKPNARESVENDPKRRKVESTTGVATATHGPHPMPLTPVTSPGLRSRPVQSHNISNGSTSVARTSIPSPISIPAYLSGYGVDASLQARAPSTTSPQHPPTPAHPETTQQANPSPTHQQTQMNAQSPQQVSPQQVSPQQVSPQQVSPQQVSPQQVPPQQVPPQQVPPQQVPPQQVPPRPPHLGNLQLGSRRTSVVQNPNSPTTPLTNGSPMPVHTLHQSHNTQPLPVKPLIMDYVATSGGHHTLLPAERNRIEWLLHAVNGGDLGFLTLHQLYCLSVNARGFLEHSNLIPGNAFHGFDFFGQILDTRNVSAPFLEFFGTFPEPIQSLMAKPGYANIVQNLLPFLRLGAHVFFEILNRCLKRQSPPTAEELVIQPFSCSTVLQRLLWRRIRNALDKGVETSSTTELEKKFMAQQIDVLKSRGLIPPPQTAQDHQGWLAQQQNAQIFANQQVIQGKYPELNRPLQPGFNYSTQPSPAFNQHHIYQQGWSGGRLVPAPIVPSSRQDGAQPQANQIVNAANSFVTLQPGLQAGQHTQQQFQYGQINQAQVVASSTSQSPPIVQSPLASTIQTPRLPGNFCQTSVVRSPGAVVGTPTDPIGVQGVGNPVRSPAVMTSGLATSSTSRRPSVVSRGNSVDHYISVIGFATQDCLLPADLPFAVREFTIQEETANRLSVWEPHPGMPGRSKRTVLDRSLIYRLRCVQAVDGKGDISKESNWVLRETTWPPHLFVSLNNESVMLRRKHIFNADLYVDITNQVKPGVNVLKISMMQDKTKLIPNGSYLLRVEILEARSYTALRNQVIPKQVIDLETAKAAIMVRLKPSEDDDVVVQLNELTLSIVCPFTMGLIKVPVRGKLCPHTECFDLDNYLISRPRKKPREPPNADSWKCPYCSGDARPTELVVDGFVMELVKQVKEMKDSEDAKEVLLKVDGSWELKKGESVKGNGPEKNQNAGEEPKKKTEVITIDDDD